MAPALNPRHAVYAGSFDPVTLGHMDIVQRAARMFDRLTVGVGVNPEKAPLFSPSERVDLLRELVAPFANVRVESFTGLTVDFVRQCGAAVMVRGLRTLTDIESEFTMTLANRALAAEIETVFLMASERYSHISSSLIKQIAKFAIPGINGGAEPLAAFVPQPVVAQLRERLR